MTLAHTLNTRPGVKDDVVKFTALSPLTTRILRARTELQQREQKLKVGRTVATWFGDPDELDRLLDHLITQEIPGAGANSKDVRRLRELRTLLRASLGRTFGAIGNPAPHGSVSITRAESPAGTGQRDRILDLIDRMWEEAAGKGNEYAGELADMADASNPNVGVDYRRWLAENL